jgi:hypothetical protein
MKSEKLLYQNVDYVDNRVEVIPFYRKYTNFMILFFPLTSFLVVPSVQGTTVITVLAAMLFGVLVGFPAGNNKFTYLRELFIFFLVYVIFSVISQFFNNLYELKLDEGLVLINKGGYMDYFYRSSHLTQTLYLLVSFIIYLFIKYYADESIITYIYWALRLLCLYAIYEFVYYKVTGASGDFLMNRKFGDTDGSLFQTTNIAGMALMRMKGYTGEPSMFTFTILPFWIMTYGLKRKLDGAILLICLVLSFSTTAYFSIIVFFTAWFLHKKRYKEILYVLIGILILLAVMQLDSLKHIFDSVYDFVFGSKLSGESSSSQDREGKLDYHFKYWTNLYFPQQLFGIGFGYIRSTDFVTTILVNNGLFGLIVFTLFVFRHLFIPIYNKDWSFCYTTGLFILYFIMMATVPEFSYPSLWIYLGLGYVLHYTSQKKLKNDEIL